LDLESSADFLIDDIDLVQGMPVGVQVVGGRFGEEKCVAVAKAIEEAMQGKMVTRANL
jgi:amidase